MNKLNVKLYSPKDKFPEEGRDIICHDATNGWTAPWSLVTLDLCTADCAFECYVFDKIMEVDEFLNDVDSWGYLVEN